MAGYSPCLYFPKAEIASNDGHGYLPTLAPWVHTWVHWLMSNPCPHHPMCWLVPSLWFCLPSATAYTRPKAHPPQAHTSGGPCLTDPHRSSVLEKKLYGVEGSSTFLECVPKSLQAQVVWTYQKASDTLKKEVRGPLHPGTRLLSRTSLAPSDS